MMHVKLRWLPLLSGLLVCEVGPLAAHDGHTPVAKVQPAETYAPGILPDRIVLTWSDDPATTQSVTWRTSIEVEHAVAEIALATGSPKFDEDATRLEATTQTLKTDLNTAHFHAATFRDLKPGMRYAYRVGDGVNWSEWFQFSTPAKDATQFSFVYFGDAQNDLRNKWSRVIREAVRDAPKAAFLLHAGDLVNRGQADAEWGEWFAAGNFLNAMIPSVPVPGNHEYSRSLLGSRSLTPHWRHQFTLPENGVPGMEETCYTFVYGNLRVIALNTNEAYEPQAVWLSSVLEQNETPWVVCTFHHPIFSTGQDRDNQTLRNTLKPIFDRFHVDLVLQGHDHTYGRTGLATPVVPPTVANVPTGVTNVDTETGTVYVVSVSGPKMYNLNRKPFMVKALSNTQLYQVISINGDELTYEARTAAGELFDRFQLRKRPGQLNELIE